MRRALWRPRPLRPGAKIGVIAPSSPVEWSTLKRGLELLKRIGPFTICLGRHLRKQRGYLAGSDMERAEDLMAMFENPTIEGVICARGGYGAARLLPLIDFDRIRSSPKTFIGSSDITILHLALAQRAGLVTFHGPMVEPHFSKRLGSLTAASFRTLVMTGHPFRLQLSGRFLNDAGTTIHGPLTGGNLTLVASSLGTPYTMKARGKVLILEEVSEAPYRVDRMLNQLRQSGTLEGVRGVIFGEMIGCGMRGRRLGKVSTQEVIRAFAQELDVPCFYPFPCGHGRENILWPVGGTITLTATSKGHGECLLTL